MKQKESNIQFFILVLASILMLLMAGQTLAQGTFTATGSMTTTREQHAETLLSDGRVLIAGGYYTGNWWEILDSAEIYDPATGTFTPTGSMSTPRCQITATLLANGMVLIAGGAGSAYLASSEIYNPATGLFTPTGNMSTPRANYTATLLASGEVLVTGGATGGATATAEIYNPATGAFTPTGSMSIDRDLHRATLLNNGKVLVTGGQKTGGPNLASAELYDPATGLFTPTGSMSAPRDYHTATLLNNGKVLVVGAGTPVENSADIYDPSTGIFTPTGSMSTPRGLHTATLLNNGKVLVAGGYNGSVTIASAELYDPISGTFAATDSMFTPRLYHRATFLNNGEVLVTGGVVSQDSWNVLSSAELYSYPMYVFSGFFSPVNNIPTVNTAKAGQVIPIKWRITNASDVGISDPSSFAGLYSYPINCGNINQDVTDAVEEVASGNSGLQYLGDGYWQFNWKTPKTYSSADQQCRVVVLNLSDGNSHYAYFTFRK